MKSMVIIPNLSCVSLTEAEQKMTAKEVETMPKFPCELNPVHEAIIFAERAHRGQKRKGTEIDYITHPMEVFQILTTMHASADLLIAGLLHDTVEDTDVTLDEIRRLFGERVAELVESHTDDKSMTWRERKQHTLDELKAADRDTKMLIMADKAANLRSMLSDYAKTGEVLWERFSAPRELLAWYSSAILDILCDMQYDEDALQVYREMTALFKDLFVDYFVDIDNLIIYQICCSGEGYVFSAESRTWNPFDGDVPECALPISRADAERFEDIWYEVYADHTLDGNELIEAAIEDWYAEKNEEGIMNILALIKERAKADGHFILPADIDENAAEGESAHNFGLKTIELADGSCAVAAFTTRQQMDNAPETAAVSLFIDSILEAVYDHKCTAGLMINPFGKQFLLDREMICSILEYASDNE